MNARKHLLDTAESLVNGDRNVQYGDPNADFARTAQMWSAYLGVEVKSHDVAVMMVLLKASRLRWTPSKEDSWVDIAGYAACGWDCVAPEPEVQTTAEMVQKALDNYTVTLIAHNATRARQRSSAGPATFTTIDGTERYDVT